ncbi:bactofilin family protein [Labilibaculum antarcticum]|uniref:Cell shape determination protein CcmA n=1 Tax=Labilibaculum antarcticum TaxID=1717717 RepID=A0A1Y1CIC2_9BACT|nr:polymer-forming cytoskeletal protein [Labilibaculum antarcticum]BAX80126.1 cell shape determination protein CcmA [Labilibaculum antarcticum]
MSKNNEVQPTAVNLICDGTSLTGDIQATRDIRIDGFLNGKMVVNGKVVVGHTGKIEGDVQCKTIDVSGRVEGNIVASEMVNLKNTAVIHGNITTDKITVEPGAKFTGSCKMGDVPPKVDVAHKKDEKKEKGPQ